MRIVDFKISNRLWLAIMLPLIAALSLASLEIWNSWSSYRQMTSIVRLSEKIATIGQIVHSLQVERGQSAGYLGAKGNIDQAPLLKARTSADEALVALPALTGDLANRRDEELVNRLTLITEAVDRLPVTRRSIDSL